MMSCNPEPAAPPTQQTSTPQPTSTTVQPTQTAQPTPTATKPAIQEPKYGGTLTVLHAHAGLEPQTWDPGESNWIVDPFTSPFLEKLVIGDFTKYGPGGTNQFPFTDMEFVPYGLRSPHLAESWELPDNLNIIYHIRKGIMFANKPGVMASREMTANDVAFALDRLIKAPKQVAQGYYKYIESVTARDKSTVVVKMKQYDSNWSLPLSWGYFTEIYPQEVVTAGISNWKNANGTGPFILKDYVSGSSLTFERNPNYWGKTTIDGKEYQLPFVNRLSWPIIVDESTRLTALRTGKVDINESVRVIYKKTLEETNPTLLRHQVLSTTGAVLSMRLDTKPFDDVRVRRALSMAIDRQAIINSLMLGEGEILTFPFSKAWGNDLFTPMDQLPQSAKELFDYNPQKAKQLMTEAGYPNGFASELVISSTGTYQNDLASLVLSMWDKELGVKVSLRPADYATYLSIMYGKTFKQMYLMSKGNGDPFAVLMVIGLPDQYWNPSLYNDPVFTDLFDIKARSATTMTGAYKFLKEANVRWIDQLAGVILPSGYGYSYAWPWVKNWYGEINSNTRQPGLIHAKVWLDQDLREKTVGKR